jgi:hypothetical protein
VIRWSVYGRTDTLRPSNEGDERNRREGRIVEVMDEGKKGTNRKRESTETSKATISGTMNQPLHPTSCQNSDCQGGEKKEAQAVMSI